MKTHKPEDKVWTVKDYKSSTITLYKPELKHIIEGHGIMARNMKAIQETITDPDKVYRDKEYDNRKVYLKSCTSATYSTKYVTKSVVENDDFSETTGFVVTAYPIKKDIENEDDKIYDKEEQL